MPPLYDCLRTETAAERIYVNIVVNTNDPVRIYDTELTENLSSRGTFQVNGLRLPDRRARWMALLHDLSLSYAAWGTARNPVM